MTPFEIVAAPLTLWVAPAGTAFPLVNAAPAGPWIKVGTNGDRNYDDGGVEVGHTQKIEQARPAGSTGPIKAWRTEEDLMISLTLWDLTLEQYRIAMNDAAVSTTAAGAGTPGTKRFGLSQGGDVAVYALLVRGQSSPYGDGFALQYEVPIVYQSGNPKPAYKKGKPAGLALEFTALENPAAVSPAERFGRLIAQHQAPLA